MARREHPRYENTVWAEYEFREFPMMVYPGSSDGGKTPDRDEDGKPGTFLQKAVTVANQEEFDAVMGFEPEEPAPAPKPKGRATLVDSGKGTQRVKTDEDERSELLEQASVKGVQVDASWSVARIQDAIDTFDAKKDVV